MPSLGISDEELEAAFKRRQTDTGKDGRVCICGHPARCHTSQTNSDSPLHEMARAKGEDHCYQTRMACSCAAFEPVIEVSDSRVFRFKTKGPSLDHALAQGMFAARKKGKTITYLDTFKCRGCGTTENLRPIAYNVLNGRIVGEAMSDTPWNALVCDECRVKMVTT